jgi:GT2 family glycosyltransferase
VNTPQTPVLRYSEELDSPASAVESNEPTVLPLLSFLISTHNRRDVLLRTLGKLREVDQLSGLVTEILVIDNASTDGTSQAVEEQFPEVRLFRLEKNLGACAKNVGLAQFSAPYVIFLDDDSYPDADSVLRMIDHFQADPKLGAAVFDVVLPDGTHECSAYPNIFIGCGTGFRRTALQESGGLPEDYFMQAEEYVLSIRLLKEGWDIRRFQDLRVSHLKTPSARMPTRTTRLDARNNLTFVTRYFPRQWMMPFALDWMRRYRWIAQQKGWRHRIAFWRGLIEGIKRSLRRGHRRPISPAVFERFTLMRDIENRMSAAVRNDRINTIVLIDLGKNILPFWLAAKSCGVQVVAIADPHFAGRRYRGVPIVDDATASQLKFDAAIVANLSPVRAPLRRRQWRSLGQMPVIDLFEAPQPLAAAA